MTLPYFNGKHVLVTGGSSGIGLSVASQLLGHGASITILARRQSLLDEAKAALGAPQRTHTLAVDVADEPAVTQKVGAHLTQYPADMLINNAGVVMPGRFVELEYRHFREMMDVNYFGTVHMCRAVIPQLIGRGGGHVLNVSSMAGAIGIYGYTAYAASKFAICGFSEALRGEMWPHKIRVSVCLPPDTDTPQLVFENQFKPAETKAIAGNVKTMTADDVATSILTGMAKGKYEIVPGMDGQLTVTASRFLPGVTRWVCDRSQKKAKP